jgi:tRNA-specific 2-thiouridylase
MNAFGAHRPHSQKVLVAVGSGMDSVVVAWLLKKQGLNVRGIYFDLIQDPVRTEWVMSLEKKIGIPIQVVDVSPWLESDVIQPWMEAKLKGFQVSLRALFQRRILFPRLCELRANMNFDRIATGHYAVTQFDSVEKVMRILKAIEAEKDEASFLFGLEQEQIQLLELPLGTIPLSMSMKIARELVVEDTLPLRNHSIWNDLKTFAIKKMGLKPEKEFEVYTTSGERVGVVPNGISYSVGDRWIPSDTVPKVSESSDDPYCVFLVDPEKSRIQLGRMDRRKISEIQLKDVDWFSMPDQKVKGVDLSFIREGYLKPVAATAMMYEGNRARLFLNHPLKGLDAGNEADLFPGQILRFVRGNEVLGGAEVMDTRE